MSARGSFDDGGSTEFDKHDVCPDSRRRLCYLSWCSFAVTRSGFRLGDQNLREQDSTWGF